MAKSQTRIISIGGGDFTSEGPFDEILKYLERKSEARIVVMTVATNEAETAANKYNSLFRSRGIKHVDVVNIEQRDDSFSEASLNKVKNADALFFTGGDQLNITSLLGGSPLHDLIHERSQAGILIAGTSAGAAMMSSSMITSGKSDTAPAVNGVAIAPGMDLIHDTIIDSHFSERGRHGRLLTAVAHYPQVLGLGIDEATAIVFENGGFRVVGRGCVTVVDGKEMRYCDLPYRRDHETIGMFGVQIHVLPNGYSYNIKERKPTAPVMKKMAGAQNDI